MDFAGWPAVGTDGAVTWQNRRKNEARKRALKNRRFSLFKNEIFGEKMRAQNASLAIFGNFGNKNGSTSGKIARKRRRYIRQN